MTEYVKWPFASNAALRSVLFGSYQLTHTNVGFFLNISRKLSFEIERGRLIIEVPDSIQISEREEVKVPPNFYEIDNPVGICVSHRYDPFEFSLSTRWYTQSETKGSLRLVEIGHNIFYIKSESITKRRSDIIITGTIGYSWEGMKIFTGVSGLQLLNWGDDSLQLMQARPLIGIGWPMLGGESLCESNLREFGFLHSIKLRHPWLSEDQPLSITSILKTSFGTFRYESLEMDLQVPLFQNVDVIVGYRKVWNRFNRLLKPEFDRWRSSLSGVLDGEPSAGIQHSAVKMGVAVQIGSEREEFPLRLIGSKIFHRSIYTAKKEFYAYNPIGTLDIHNVGKRSIVCQVCLDLPERIGSYKSESLKIGPDEVKTVPVYLYLTEQRFQEPSSPVQMDIAVEIGEKKHSLSSVPVTVFDVHSWDGNTWGLRYYLTPNEPAIQTNAKRNYIKSLKDDSLLTEPPKKMTQLTNFLSELGRNLHYVQDPTSSLYVDRMQYPIETMELQSGDCEDLAVYIASHLMAVGIQCAFVDIKPQAREIDLPTAGQRQLGHIFLLVNTEIGPECVGELGLKEFQFVSRTSAMGKSTIWIPIETTVLNQGFDRAFHDGVQQYYEEVIERNGINNGSVHVYDF